MGGRVASERERAEDDSGCGRQRSSGSPEQLASLTPLRGIAALWVVIFHFCWYFPAVHPERYTGAVYKGYLAVDMFFVLSGFVITHVYKEGFARRVTGRRYRDFLKARVARIYPLHIAVHYCCSSPPRPRNGPRATRSQARSSRYRCWVSVR